MAKCATMGGPDPSGQNHGPAPSLVNGVAPAKKKEVRTSKFEKQNTMERALCFPGSKAISHLSKNVFVFVSLCGTVSPGSSGKYLRER